MAIAIYPMTASFAAEIGDIDLSGQIDPADLLAIKEAFAKYAVLIFPDQHLSQDQHLDFARHFGPLETTIGIYRKDAPLRLPQELTDVSNLDSANQIWGKESRRRFFQLGARLWHTDNSFKRLPARASLLYARSIPPVGGHTEFADLSAAYDALPEATKRRIADLVAEHSLLTSRAKLGFADFDETERKAFEPVPQVLVRRLQDSGRMSLYLASHAGTIRGMSKPEGEKLLKELIDHATQRQFVYTHRWRVNDLVMWDDRCTMHRGLEFDDQRYKRDMRRATVSDVAPTCEQMGLAVAAE